MTSYQFAGGMPFEFDEQLSQEEIDQILVVRERNCLASSRHHSVALTDDLVRSVQSGPREKWIRDLVIPYLHLRVRPSGHKSYYLVAGSDRRLPRDQRFEEARRECIGDLSHFTIAEARIKAGWSMGIVQHVKPPPKLRRDMRINEAVVKYYNDYPPEASDWNITKKSLITQYVLPRCGDETFSGVTLDRWILYCENAAMDKRSRGKNLHKTLGALLSWAVQRGLLRANPLSKSKFELPPLRKPAYLGIEDLAAIWEAARELGEPWFTMIGLVILTGAGIEDVRRIQRGDIDQERSEWKIERVRRGGFHTRCPLPIVPLSPEALALLSLPSNREDYLFPSPSSLRPAPINFYSERLEGLRARSKIEKTWGMRDCRSAAHSKIVEYGEARWAKRFHKELDERQSARDGTDVVL
jgi:integrase